MSPSSEFATPTTGACVCGQLSNCAIAALSEKLALSDVQVLMVSLLALGVCLVSFNHDFRLNLYLLAYEANIGDRRY